MRFNGCASCQGSCSRTGYFRRFRHASSSNALLLNPLLLPNASLAAAARL